MVPNKKIGADERSRIEVSKLANGENTWQQVRLGGDRHVHERWRRKSGFLVDRRLFHHADGNSEHGALSPALVAPAQSSSSTAQSRRFGCCDQGDRTIAATGRLHVLCDEAKLILAPANAIVVLRLHRIEEPLQVLSGTRPMFVLSRRSEAFRPRPVDADGVVQVGAHQGCFYAQVAHHLQIGGDAAARVEGTGGGRADEQLGEIRCGGVQGAGRSHCDVPVQADAAVASSAPSSRRTVAKAFWICSRPRSAARGCPRSSWP